MTTGRLLAVDDDEDVLDLVSSVLKSAGHKVTTTTSPNDALDQIVATDFDCLITDLGMDEMDGLALCERALGRRPGLPIVVLTGQGSMESAIAALRVGAYDFLTKPVDAKLLGPSIGRAVQTRALQHEVKRLADLVEMGTRPANLVGASTAMSKVNDLVGRVASSEASVLIWGETGTGKELVARSIHSQSRRGDGPFVAINCAAVPANLLESELFGHARGAFTDAKTTRTGIFVQATGGTLFLDEIGEMPLEMQAKLLRALQERTVRPVGSNTEIPFDARIVAATNRDLEEEIFHKRFREDLYFRINVVKIDLPPLRERAKDVLELATYFIDAMARRTNRAEPLALSVAAAEKLLAYEWPGNVRELENCIERAVAMARFREITPEDLPERIRAYRNNRIVISAETMNEIVTVDELERRYIGQVLKLVGGNKSKAAQMLGLDRRTLYRKLDRYDVTSSPAGGPNGSSGTRVD